MNAEARFKEAFDQPPRIDRAAVTRADAARANQYFRRNAARVSARRGRIVRRTQAAVVAYAQAEFGRLNRDMAQSRSWLVLAEDAARVGNGIRREGDSQVKLRMLVRRRLEENPAHGELVLSVLRDRAEAAGLFSGMDRVLNTGRVLLAESGALFTRGQIETLRGTARSYAPLPEREESARAFTSDDIGLVEIVFGNRPSQLADSIAQRVNRITSVPLTDAMFERLRDTIMRSLYQNAVGALGAVGLADQIEAEFGSVLGDATEAIADRAELWARTEGAVMQNDALLSIAEQSGMDGKIWQSLQDGLVRTFATSDGDHVINDEDGVIPLGDRFSDGSTDGGSGSVSPYQCRCAVGGALLGA